MTISPMHVAVAIVAAAKETGADPAKVLCGWPPSGIPLAERLAHSRARMYAATAIAAVLGVREAKAARLVGVSNASAPAYFQTIARNRDSWWDAAAYGRVFAALLKEAGPVHRPTAVETVKSVLEDERDRRPVMDRGSFGGVGPRRDPPAPQSKADLLRGLAEAAANTAKLPTS